MASSLSVGTKVWADRINAAWRKSAESVIETGQLLREAKKNADKGGFQKMLETELDFEPSVARKLMAIAGDARLTEACHLARLPKHWTTLYSLHKLSDDDLQTALGSAAPITGASVAQARAPVVIDVDHEDITPSADEADTPAVATEGLPGSAVLDSGVSSFPSPNDAADRHEGGDSDDRPDDLGKESVFDNEPASPSAVAVDGVIDDQLVMETGLAFVIERSKNIPVDQFFANLRATFEHEDVNHFCNWMLDFEELVKVAKQTEEAEAAE